jgi:hypothetical protein
MFLHLSQFLVCEQDITLKQRAESNNKKAFAKEQSPIADCFAGIGGRGVWFFWPPAMCVTRAS